MNHIIMYDIYPVCVTIYIVHTQPVSTQQIWLYFYKANTYEYSSLTAGLQALALVPFSMKGCICIGQTLPLPRLQDITEMVIHITLRAEGPRETWVDHHGDIL